MFNIYNNIKQLKKTLFIKKIMQIPVTVVLMDLVKPTNSTSFPFLSIPLSNLPVTTVPLPVI